MAFRKREKTLAERVAETTAAKEAALSVFVTAAEQLDATVAEAGELGDAVAEEIARLAEVRSQAYATRSEAQVKAALIRKSFLG